MRPETVHLIATLTRHGRGMVNAIEKFERTIPREMRAGEVSQLVAFGRRLLVSVDESLQAVPIESGPSAASNNGSGVPEQRDRP
jgi:hypothetical protein